MPIIRKKGQYVRSTVPRYNLREACNESFCRTLQKDIIVKIMYLLWYLYTPPRILLNYPCTAKRRIKYINSLIYSILLTRFCI